jgi:hypothetical protein
LDAFSPAVRNATAEVLGGISEQCDGIRCDMAMLLTNEVFARTWGGRTGPAPAEEFWPTVIGLLRRHHPAVVLIAEAYWDLEWELQKQGFDFCYDKRLYDRLMATDPGAVRAHLGASTAYQRRLVRFLENHDEPRVAERLGPDEERAAAVVIATLPGATLWHEGQFEGRRVRPPVFLSRRPEEPADHELAAFYHALVAAVETSGLRQGEWRLLVVTGWPDNQSCANLLAWSWSAGDSGPAGASRFVVVVNLSWAPAQGRVVLGWADLGARPWQFTDLVEGSGFVREGDELQNPGLFVDLAPWKCHVLALR